MFISLFSSGLRADEVYLKGEAGKGHQGTVLEESDSYIIIRFPRSEIQRIIRTSEETPGGGKKSPAQDSRLGQASPSSPEESRPVQGYFPTKNPLILPEDMKRLSASESREVEKSRGQGVQKSGGQGVEKSRSPEVQESRSQLKEEIKAEVLKELRSEEGRGVEKSRSRGVQESRGQEVEVGYGSVRGKVENEAGPLPGVRVKLVGMVEGDILGGIIRAARYGREFETGTDGKGMFVFSKVPAGAYKFKWQPPGDVAWYKLLRDGADVEVQEGKTVTLKPLSLEHPKVEVEREQTTD